MASGHQPPSVSTTMVTKSKIRYQLPSNTDTYGMVNSRGSFQLEYAVVRVRFSLAIMPPSKVCPQCQASVPLKLKLCKCCQHVFQSKRKAEYYSLSDQVPIVVLRYIIQRSYVCANVRVYRRYVDMYTSAYQRDSPTVGLHAEGLALQ